MNPGYAIDHVCVATNDGRLGMATSDMVNHMEWEIVNSGAPFTLASADNLPGGADIGRDLGNARESLCNREEPPTIVNPFTLTYSSCSCP